MIVSWGNDGQIYEKEQLNTLGFTLNESRDVRRRAVYDNASGEETGTFEYVYDFVGFLVNDNNDMFAVFPKHFTVKDVDADASALFAVVAKHRQRHPDMYLGEQYGEKFQANYPFAAFFGIYDYYTRYGLYVEDKSFVKLGTGGKINWKETIRRTDFLLSGGEVAFYPLYHNQRYYFSTFLTECMVFAIDYTIDKFGVFLGLDKTGQKEPEFDFWGNREAVLQRLLAIRQQVFRDNLLELIDNLYLFFSKVKQGGSFYFKHYTFYAVWEDMVLEYLRNNFKEISGNSLIFDRVAAKHLHFEKIAFHPNLAKTEQFFAPDYYAVDGNTQFLFDAKYYNCIHGMDYKQLAYFLFLNEMRDREEDEQPKYTRTFSALLLPSEERKSRVHFQMAPCFNKSYGNMMILEEYLDIREVMTQYCVR